MRSEAVRRSRGPLSSIDIHICNLLLGLTFSINSPDGFSIFHVHRNMNHTSLKIGSFVGACSWLFNPGDFAGSVR